MTCHQEHVIRERHRGKRGNLKCHAGDPDCPHPQSVEQLEFKARPMVDWLHPGQLVSTGLKQTTAKTFGAYADKRETQAAMAMPREDDFPFDVDFDYSNEGDELWFDYIADLGDGFDATYTMARLLATGIDSEKGTLQQGRFVVLGGDQVYPTASRDEYEHRFLGPYQAANPWSAKLNHLYALPGNHDWYDGLTSFLRIFCQTRKAGDGGRWIGAWRTQQRRSYFALRLPHDWWIWGIDSQLESDLDRPQVEYFTRLAAAMLELPGEPSRQKIILMTAEPNWVFCGDEEAKAKQCPISATAFNTLMWFENRLIRRNGFTLPLAVAGDLHHYVRYTSTDSATHRVTSGGGGAYLMGTHQMPGAIRLPEGTTETTVDQMPVRVYKQQHAYPHPDQSTSLTENVLFLPLRNKWFASLLGAAYAMLALSMFRWSVFSLVAGALLIWAFVSYTDASVKHQPLAKTWQGWVHGGLHVGLATVCWQLAMFLAAFLPRMPNWLKVTAEASIVSAFAFFVGYFFGGVLFARYLLWSSTTSGAHTEELFSSMAITGFKNFLRMNIDRDGRLHVYAVGVDEVPSQYEFVAPGPEDCGKAWFAPKKAGTPPRIIDELTIDPASSRGAD